LDSWNPEDSTVPAALKITSLPNTIERFMMEATNTGPAYIRKAQDNHNHRSTKRVSNAKEQPGVMDKYCFFCGGHGHVTTTCEFMAKFITAMDNIN
jgi:hypothetical protein